MVSRWEGILVLIFHGFWSILEAKMEPSWEGKSIKNRCKKGIKKQMRKVAVLAASWPPLGRLLAASWRHLSHGNRWWSAAV